MRIEVFFLRLCLTMFFSDREVPRRSQLRKEELPRRMEKVPFDVNNRGIAISDTLF